MAFKRNCEIKSLNDLYEFNNESYLKERQESFIKSLKNEFSKISESEKYLCRLAKFNENNKDHKTNYDKYFNEIEKV